MKHFLIRRKDDKLQIGRVGLYLIIDIHAIKQDLPILYLPTLSYRLPVSLEYAWLS